jgi:hypothetical protein
MPSAYPFPSLATLALSLWASDRKLELLPRTLEVQPWEHARLNDSFAGIYNAHVDGYEGI